MEIYEFIWNSDEIYWVFAPNIEEAKKYIIINAGCSELVGCSVMSIPKSDWPNCYILDINDMEPSDADIEYNEDDYFNGYKIIETFSEYAERETTTDIIATSCY